MLMIMEHRKDMMQEAWRWIPNVLYSLAPKPWPQSVSSAPLNPVWEKEEKEKEN